MNISREQPFEQSEHSQKIRASNLSVIDEERASQEIRRLYQQFREDFGRPQVPGILQCFATHPPLLTHMMGLAKSMLFVDGALGREDKEMISTFVSASNKCSYCTDSHAYSFRMQGASEAVLGALLACDPESNDIPEKQCTLLRFSKKITEDSQSITASDIEEMRTAGWSDLQIAEAIHVTALFAAFNRVVNAFGLPSQELLKEFELSPQHEVGGVAHG